MKELLKKRQSGSPYAKRLMLYIVDKDPLEVLTSTPSAISGLIRAMKKRQLGRKPAPGRWSIAEIVAHLTDGEIVLGYRLRKIIAEPGSKIESYDQNKWADRMRYGKSDCREKLSLFSALRKNNVKLLKSLKTGEWKRYGIHSERGKESVGQIVLLYAGHDMNHIKQIENLKILFSNK